MRGRPAVRWLSERPLQVSVRASRALKRETCGATSRMTSIQQDGERAIQPWCRSAGSGTLLLTDYLFDLI